ncbi:MAG: site-specific integrase [Acidimicrobiales bacterium]
MARRSGGEGTVIETSNGRWAAVIELPRTGNGKRQRRWRRARTKAEAQALLRKMQDELALTGAIADPQRTVGKAIAQYRQVRASTEGLSRGTLEHDKGPLNLIESGLGGRKLSSLSVDDCDRFLRQATDGKFGRPLGKRYVRRLRRTLINVLQNEMRIGTVTRNLAELTMTPNSSKPAKEMRALTVEELIDLLELATDGRLIIIDLCGRNGLRPAEARAVRWQDVNLDAGELTISGQLNRRSERTAPKTKKAGRTIQIDEQTIGRLKLWKDTQNELRSTIRGAWVEHDLVATTAVGSPVDRHSLARSLRLYCQKLGIEPAVSPYELRHTAISMQADVGQASWEIADWAGTSEAMISDVYRHRLRRVSNLLPVVSPQR